MGAHSSRSDPLGRFLEQASSGCYVRDAFVGSLAGHLSYETIGQCLFRLNSLYLDAFLVSSKERTGVGVLFLAFYFSHRQCAPPPPKKKTAVISGTSCWPLS